MGFFNWLFGKHEQPQPASPRRPNVIRGLDDGSPFVVVENENGAVMMMDRMAYEYMYGESKKPDPSQQALDGLLAQVARVKVWAGGMMRDKPTSDDLLADVTEPALLESFRRAFRISEDSETFGHCMCFGDPHFELYVGPRNCVGATRVDRHLDFDHSGALRATEEFACESRAANPFRGSGQGGVNVSVRTSSWRSLPLFPNFYLARRRTQCLTSSYSGTAVGRILKTLIRPRRFNSRTAFCTAVLERPVPSESLCRLNRTRFCSAR